MEFEKGIRKIKEKQRKIKNEILKQTTVYILAALGFVVGLAWNDAVRSLIEFLFPLQKNGLVPKFFYAVIITIVMVVITIYLTASEEGDNK